MIEEYDPHQGNKTNFEYMKYQLKYLEQVLGSNKLLNWINLPNPALDNKTPAECVLLMEEDRGCKILGDLISDMLTGSLG